MLQKLVKVGVRFGFQLRGGALRGFLDNVHHRDNFARVKPCQVAGMAHAPRITDAVAPRSDQTDP
jgi:hypothetical protein